MPKVLTQDEALRIASNIARATNLNARDSSKTPSVEHARQIEPAPADDLEIGEVGLLQLIGCRGLVGELVRCLHDDEGGTADQIERLQQAVDRS
jgi:hypothetical protein